MVPQLGEIVMNGIDSHDNLRDLGNIPLCPGNVYGEKKQPPLQKIERGSHKGSVLGKKTIGDSSRSRPSVNIPKAPENPGKSPSHTNIPGEIPMREPMEEETNLKKVVREAGKGLMGPFYCAMQ